MTGKRAFQYELQAKKVDDYTHKIKTLINRVNIDPFAVDYSEEIERLYKSAPKDRGIIRLAEQEAYIQAKMWSTQND